MRRLLLGMPPATDAKEAKETCPRLRIQGTLPSKMTFELTTAVKCPFDGCKTECRNLFFGRERVLPALCSFTPEHSTQSLIRHDECASDNRLRQGLHTLCCPETPLPCPFDDCGKTWKLGSFEDAKMWGNSLLFHLRTECLHTEPCFVCKKPLQMRDRMKHYRGHAMRRALECMSQQNHDEVLNKAVEDNMDSNEYLMVCIQHLIEQSANEQQDYENPLLLFPDIYGNYQPENQGQLMYKVTIPATGF